MVYLQEKRPQVISELSEKTPFWGEVIAVLRIISSSSLNDESINVCDFF